ncbi:MAG: SpoIIE family protein phosphatase [Clostridia bacterium]|nr:SpoIIE family protein phosphatase [Clostridia bacterium]
MNKRYYRKIADEISSAVIVTDGNLKTLFVNGAFQKLFPGARAKCFVGECVNCADGTGRCLTCPAASKCPLVSAFLSSAKTRGEVAGRIDMNVRVGASEQGASFPLSVKPIGKNVYLGIIDPSAEYMARLRLAADVQQRFLPTQNFAGSKTYSYIYKPLNEVSGDVVETYSVDGRACAMIADVSGKDVSAGMLTQFVRGAFDKGIRSPAAAISALEERFCELEADEKNYITVAAVRIDDGFLTYSMAGHNAPMLLKTEGGITKMTSSCPPVSNWFDEPAYFEDAMPYSSGDMLVMLTDGVTECRNPAGETFGVESVQRVLSVSTSSSDFTERLDRALSDFGAEPKDDITAIAFDL